MADDPFDFQSPDDYLNDPAGGSYSGGAIAENPTGGFDEFSISDIFSDVADYWEDLSLQGVQDWFSEAYDTVTGAFGGTGGGGGASRPSGASGGAVAGLRSGLSSFVRSPVGIVTLGIVAGLIVWRLLRR